MFSATRALSGSENTEKTMLINNSKALLVYLGYGSFVYGKREYG